jgi:hypothetical protein
VQVCCVTAAFVRAPTFIFTLALAGALGTDLQIVKHSKDRRADAGCAHEAAAMPAFSTRPISTDLSAQWPRLDGR